MNVKKSSSLPINLLRVVEAAARPTALTLDDERRNRLTTRQMAGLYHLARTPRQRVQALRLNVWWQALALPGAFDQQLDGRLYGR